MHPTDQAIEEYNHLLRHSDVARLWPDFLARMQENLLTFGERPVCSVLRPAFLHPREYERIAMATEALTSAIHKIYDAMRRRDLDMATLLHLSPAEAALTQLPDRYGRPDVSARMDAFWQRGDSPDQGELYFVEYNADSPGGLSYADVLGELFLELAPMRRFAENYHVQGYAVRRHVHCTLVDCYHDWCVQSGRSPAAQPNIAIVDWRTVRTRNEFILSSQIFEEQGSKVKIVDPDELVLRDGRLWADEFAVDIVYKRVVVNEFIHCYPEPDSLMAHPLVQAVAQDAVCITNHFNCQLLYNKVIFALLSDEENAHFLDRDEQTVIDNHLPWTRLVADRRTRYGDQEVDLLDFIRGHKDQLVLKPIREYGGTGVLLGWEVEPETWEAGLATAMRTPYIVQKRVPIPQAQFPVYEEGTLRFVPRMMDIDPYVWRGQKVAHAGVRLAASSLLNVSAGGGSAVPLFLVERKR
jgi:hypothetical protein